MWDTRSSAHPAEHTEASEWERVAYEPLRRADSAGLSRGWLIAGVAVAVLGFLAARHFGPDLRRYIKMERM